MPAPTVTREIEKKGTAGNVASTVTVPGGVNWTVKAVELKLVTGVAVANRQVGVQLRDAEDDPIFVARLGVAHAASLTRYYTYAPGLPDGAAFIDTDKLMGVLPLGIKLLAGCDINIAITLGDAGDTYDYRIIVDEDDQAV